MLQLKEIIDVRNSRVCFCGRSLVGEFCNVHGTDIRVEMFHIDARFQITGIPFQELFIDVSIPSNQFNRLFRSQNSIQSDVLGELRYEIRITLNKDINDVTLLVEDIIEELELEPFFGEAFIIQMFRIKWKSGVTIFYLFRYKVISKEIVHFLFTAVPLRRLSEYISWRMKQCRGNRHDISNSLKNVRSKVLIQENGEPGKIVDLMWYPNKKLPSKIIVEKDNTHNSQVTKLSTQLYHGAEHFFIGQRKEAEARVGLDNIASNFLNQFQLLIKMKSLIGRITKLKDDKKRFDHLIGSSVRSHYEFLKAVGENQNRQFQRRHLESLMLDKSSKQPRKLLIISCSATKDPQSEPIPAILRYSGVIYLLLKSIILSNLWPQNIDLLIVSAKYGLLKPLEELPYYEQLLTSERVLELRKVVEEQIAIKNIDLSCYSECFLNISKLYYQSIEGLTNSLKCRIIRGDEKGNNKRNSAMLTWLAQEQIHNNENL